MHHPFMERASQALGAHGIATHRFEFPYMKAGKSRPDSPAVAEAAVREAVREAARNAAAKAPFPPAGPVETRVVAPPERS